MQILKTSLAVALLSLSLSTQAQSYPQKLAALQNRVHIDMGIFIPEVEKAVAVEQLYRMVFQSGAGQYFNSKDGLVRSIVLREIFRTEPTNEELVGITRLKGNVLYYPTKFDASAIILERLAEESTILEQIPRAAAQLKNILPNLNLHFERDVLQRAPNTNVSRLELITRLKNVLNANPEITNSIRSYKKFTVVDSTDNILSNQLHISSREVNKVLEFYATLSVGREGLYEQALYFNEAILEQMFKLAFLKGFGTKTGYYMKSEDFANALTALDNYLATSGKSEHLIANGVEGFEFDENYARRERLFTNGILTVGTTEESIRTVVELFFP